MTVVTFEELKDALRAILGPQGMGREEVSQVAEYLLGFFGFSTEVIDNVLEPEDRDVFYMLEEEGLLGTRQEEIMVTRGKTWRIHYWTLKVDKLRKALKGFDDERDTSETIYDSLSEEVWARQ